MNEMAKEILCETQRFFENFEGLKITHDQTIVLIPFVEFHPQNIIRCNKIFDENGPISMAWAVCQTRL